MENNSKRKFLVLCLGGLAAAASGTLIWPVYRFLAPLPKSATAGKIVIPEKDVPEGEAKFFEFGGSSAVLIRKKGGGLSALSAVCTHLGCIIQWEKDKQSFLCPCHGGRFAADGAVTAGPPPRPLARLPFTVNDGNITIG